MRPDLLAKHILFLQKKGYAFKTLKDALAEIDGKTAVVTFDDGYVDNFELGLSCLSRLHVPATLFVPTAAIGKKHFFFSEAGDKTPSDFLNSDELCRLRDAGWEIASHGHEHIHLSQHSVERQENDLKTSRDILQDVLREPVAGVAYPYGFYSEATKKIAANLGFQYGATTEIGPATLDGDLYALKRIPLFGQNIFHLPLNLIQLKKHL